MLVVLGIMVLVHEFGHFAVAKFFGVRVEVFSIGFGKRLFGFRRGDTDYRISLLPLGGYVKMAGETPGEARTGDPGEFASHPRWQRILIGLAGPVANFMLAFVLMAGLYMMHNEVPNYMSSPAVTDIVPQDSPAGAPAFRPAIGLCASIKIRTPPGSRCGMRAALDVNSYVPVTVERMVERPASALESRALSRRPEQRREFRDRIRRPAAEGAGWPARSARCYAG